jgi:hypothetical protein
VDFAVRRWFGHGGAFAPWSGCRLRSKLYCSGSWQKIQTLYRKPTIQTGFLSAAFELLDVWSCFIAILLAMSLGHRTNRSRHGGGGVGVVVNDIGERR